VELSGTCNSVLAKVAMYSRVMGLWTNGRKPATRVADIWGKVIGADPVPQFVLNRAAILAQAAKQVFADLTNKRGPEAAGLRSSADLRPGRISSFLA
jgi:hypothetical protein